MLLRSDEVRINDHYAIDSFVIGQQRRRAQGVRLRCLEDRREQLDEKAKGLPISNKLVAFK